MFLKKHVYIFWFDLPIRKEEGKFKQGKIMSTKVCQRVLYSIPTLDTKSGLERLREKNPRPKLNST